MARGERLIVKIIRLTAENVKRLKVVDITASAGLNQITGKNGNGKTSVLDSIYWTLAGKDGIQPVPIRAGQSKARVRLDLGEIIVERHFTKAGTTLKVQNTEGAVYPSPQALLDALMGELSFDPLEFSRMGPKEQLTELRRISKLAVDIDAIEAENKADYAKRTDINRQAKAKSAQASGISVPTDLPARRLDESELLDQIQQAGEHNAAIEREKARRAQLQRDANDKKSEGVRLRNASAECREATTARVAELQREIERVRRDGEAKAARLDDEATTALGVAARMEKAIDEAPAIESPREVVSMRAALEQAKTVNAGIASRERRSAIEVEVEALERSSQEITDRMAAREKAKNDAIAAAEMPVEGLGFGEDGVTYNGLPFQQSSDADQLRVSCSIAMAANSKLRILRIKNGSLLDDDGIKLIAQLADDKDYQVWMERVDSSGKIGIVMEDGEVKSHEEDS